MKFVGTALKAFYASVAAGLASLYTALVGGVGIGGVTAAQWVAIASAMLLAFGAVYGVTNAPSIKTPNTGGGI